jgi:hypothetical protein
MLGAALPPHLPLQLRSILQAIVAVEPPGSAFATDVWLATAQLLFQMGTADSRPPFDCLSQVLQPLLRLAPAHVLLQPGLASTLGALLDACASQAGASRSTRNDSDRALLLIELMADLLHPLIDTRFRAADSQAGPAVAAPLPTSLADPARAEAQEAWESLPPLCRLLIPILLRSAAVASHLPAALESVLGTAAQAAAESIDPAQV